MPRPLVFSILLAASLALQAPACAGEEGRGGSGSSPAAEEEASASDDLLIGSGAADLGIEYVPTFVVSRDGVEVGRVVEESTDGIERHLLALLSGEARGVLSARTDLGGS